MLRSNLSNFKYKHAIIMLWNDLVLLTYNILKNEISWKSWLDLRLSRDSMLKWILKWLPLDRGYYKFYFRKGKSILIISCHTYFRTREFVDLFQVVLCITMHFIPVKCLEFRDYWLTIPRETGGMETLARSSVSLSPLVRVKFKWLPLDRGPFKFIFMERDHLIPKHVINCAHPFVRSR